MICIREPKDGELKGTAAHGQFQLVCEENGEITGYVACSILETHPGNFDAWLHDIGYSGSDPSVAPILARRAIRWIRSKGYTTYYCNASTRFAYEVCKKHQGEIHQVVFKMEMK